MSNVATLQLKIKVSDDGTIKVLDSVGKSAKKAGDEGKRSFDKMGASMRAMESNLKSAGIGIKGIYNSVFSLKSAFAGAGIGLFIRDLYHANVQMTGFNRAFAAGSGSIEAGAKQMEWLRGITDRLGLQFELAAGSYKGILAAAEGTTLEGKGVQIVFQGIAEAGRAMNLTNDQMEGSLYALQQMMSKGKVSAEEMNQQLGERLPGAVKYAAEAMGVTTQALYKMMEQGELIAEDFLPKFGELMHEKFGGDAVKAAHDAQAEMARFQNSVFNLKVELASGQFITTVTETLRTLTGYINEHQTELADMFNNAIDGAKNLPGHIDNIVVSLKKYKEEMAWFVDNWEIIAGIWAGAKFGPWGAAVGAGVGLFVDQKKDIEAAFTAQEKLNAATAKYNSLAYSNELDLPFAATAEDVNAARQEVERLEKQIKDADIAGWKSISPDDADIKNFQVFGDVVDLGGKKAATAATATTGLTKAQKDAEKAAEKHAEKIKDVIANLQWETQMLALSEDEQYRMNALKLAGIGINDKMAASVLGVADAYLEAKKNAESWKPFLDFMSDESTNEMAIQLHEAAVDIQAENLKSMEEYNADLSKNSSDTAEEVTTAWEEAAKNIQNALAGLFNDISSGAFESPREMILGIAKAGGSAWTESFAATVMDGFKDSTFIEDIAKSMGSVFSSDKAKDEMKVAVLGVVSNAVAAVASGSKGTMIGTGIGTVVGGIIGAVYGGGNAYTGAAIGSSVGGGIGSMFESQPGYGEQLSKAMEPLKDELELNTRALENNTQEIMYGKDYSSSGIISKFFDPALLVKDVFDNRSLVENLKLPLIEVIDDALRVRVRKYGDSEKENYQYIKQAYNQSGLDIKLDASTNRTPRDAKPAELESLFNDLFKSFGDDSVNGLVRMSTAFNALSEGDVTPLFDELAKLPQYADIGAEGVRELYRSFEELYESGAKADRNKKTVGPVIDAAFEEIWASVENDVTATFSQLIPTIESFGEQYGLVFESTFTDINGATQLLFDTALTAKDKALKGVDDSFENISKEVAGLKKLSEAGLIKLEPEIQAFVDNFDSAITQIKAGVEEFYAAARTETLADMTAEMDAASGKFSKMEQSYQSIDDAAEKYRLELIDQGMGYIEAGNAARDYSQAMKDAARATQLAADTANYEARILQAKISRTEAFNGTDDLQILNQELINSNRKAEVQALMDTYKAGTPAYQAMIKLAKETWGFEDAANNATAAMAKVAEAMEGMWTVDSESVAKGWWLQINEALGRAFTPALFLDSLGLGKDSGLEGLLSANSMEEVDADLRELITLWRTGKIKEDQANSILSKINENAATIGQKIDDLANSLSQQREIGKASQEWYDSFFADSGLSELDKSLKDAGDTLEEFLQQIRDAGGSIRAGWEAGGTIETAVKDTIRSNFLADFRSEFADAASQSSYMQSKSDITKQAGDWEQTYLGATVDPEIIAARIAVINSALTENLTILNQQLIARAGEEGVLKGINESITILTDNAQNSITTLQGLARSEEELAAIRQYAADQTRQLNLDLLNNIRGTAFDITGDTDILTQQLIDLAADWQKADAQDYGAQYDILTKQNDILTQLRDIQKQQLEETISNYNAIQDVILELQGGSLAPVQSLEFFQRRYDQLYDAAQSGKTSDISAFTGFINQYADFMGGIDGLDYKGLVDGIISDMEGLQSAITGGATLDDLNAQLEALNSANSPIVSELIRIGDILAGLTGSGSLSQAMAFDEQAYLQRYADVAAAVMAGQFASGLEHYQEFGLGENRLPGFARGGSFIAGENGAEIVNISPGSSARIFNGGDTAKIIADAVSKAIGGALGGGNVTVHVSLDGRAIEPRMIKVIQTSDEAQYQIKRVANGR